MKIILSRKGFDSSYGGVPSPILDGQGPFSLPIPVTVDGMPARSFRIADMPLGDTLSDLTGGRLSGKTIVHLDPDLDARACERQAGWRPALGQDNAAQAHLRNQGVGPGDLFLFFGWFREARLEQGRWAYRGPSAGFHALFGWLQVHDVLDIDGMASDEIPPWLNDHPHFKHANALRGKLNTVYIGTEHLELGSSSQQDRSIPGAGRFRRWSPSLRLSAPGGTRSIWTVPGWFKPSANRPPLTYHGNPNRWIHEGDGLRLRTVGRGQEFVLDSKHYPEALGWAQRLIEAHAGER